MKISVYAIVFALVIASWIGNIAYSRGSQLPEGQFLRHYAETDYTPGNAFDLLFVANNNDKRKLIDVRIEELPAFKYFPIQVHREYRHQSIYIVRGYFEEETIEPRAAAMEPLTVHSIKALYSDGTESEEDIGEIIVYRDAWPMAADKVSAVELISGMGSSDNSGSGTIRISKPVKLTEVKSRLLDKMKNRLEIDVKPASDRGIPMEGAVVLPVELNLGESLTVHYRFQLSKEDQASMEVYRLLLREKFQEPDGHQLSNSIIADYLPNPTEGEMRAYVRDKRRQAG